MTIGYTVLQFPNSILIDEGASTGVIYGRVYKAGVTDPAGAPNGIIAEIGFGPSGSDPTSSSGWQWTGATFNTQFGNDDEFTAELSGLTAGTFAYTFRFSDDGGITWTYADLDGNGIGPGLSFNSAQLGSLTVNAINDAPTDITLSSTTINENNSPNAVVATLAAIDPDVGDTFTFALVAGAGDTDNGAFSISGNQLVLNHIANFEVKPSYSIRLLVTDAAGLTHEVTQIITVGNVNEAPTGVSISGTSVAELAANGTVVSTLVASDPDAGNTITYSLVDNAGGRFAISGSSIIVADSLLLDFEQNASHLVTIRATDQNGLFIDTVVSLSVTNILNEIVVGDGRANVFVGGSGIDILNGGLGSDQLAGGDGDDYYFVDGLASSDMVTETNADFVTGGNDLVTYTGTSGTYLLGANIERLTLGGAAAINGTGNALANIIIGNSAANAINGSSGSDTMFGGNGSDTYYADLTTDIITETNADLATGGNDIVYFSGTSGTFTLSANVERLFLSGVAAINGTGNALANVLIGNGAANILNGGLGIDTMNGGNGSDSYFANVFNDFIQETNADLLTGGNDLVNFIGASGTFVLGANIERLTLVGATATAAINGTGNTLANTISGNAGNNIIDGGAGIDMLFGNSGNDTLNGGSGTFTDYLYGGLGNDTLTGGLGNDVFVFNSLPNALTNRDTITDFNVANDTIWLENTGVFTALGIATGILNASMFKDLGVAGAVLDADDRIIYNHNTGVLLYDANGSGAGGSIHFATLTVHPILTNADFVVI